MKQCAVENVARGTINKGSSVNTSARCKASCRGVRTQEVRRMSCSLEPRHTAQPVSAGDTLYCSPEILEPGQGRGRIDLNMCYAYQSILTNLMHTQTTSSFTTFRQHQVHQIVASMQFETQTQAALMKVCRSSVWNAEQLLR
ncbi:hypothetical protein DPEC_G00082140 [Dallia pectoralis]|uniref:Uncharacterized protein n=1 Tax=Dallia pectoralis TaxID=75939 RepID=A0ACC2GZ96_DALPE|nr:hypothetical protein DPEC_G00082140 [Dallia pectoralis]